jgi:magnesium transporter
VNRTKSNKHRLPHFRRRQATVGAPPGSLIIDPESPKPEMHVIAYDKDRFVDRDISEVSAIKPLLEAGHVVWVNVEGLGSERTLRDLASLFHLHPLAMEDVVNVHQRPKVDRYGELLFITLRMHAQKEVLQTEQVSLFVGKKFVVTFLEDPGDCFEAVRRRLRESDGLIRQRGSDYLAYALLDGAIDAFFPLLEEFGEQLEALEDEVILKPTPKAAARIHDAKFNLRALRRVIWPLRDAMNELARDSSSIICDETRVYLRDLYDHTVQIIDIVETYREMGSDLTDLYLSSLSNRMNEIMRVLTVIATLFMPLSFIVGIYGMNFNTESPWNMPELNWRFGYVLVWGVILVATLGMLGYFYRRGWLGAQTKVPWMQLTEPAEEPLRRRE